MKIFLDSADVKTIAQWSSTGVVDGITTNPSSLSKQGGDPKKIVLDICNLLPTSDISVEVTTKKPEDVYKQAVEIAALAPNICVKIPCHRDYYGIIKKLVQKDIKINITLVFSLAQALMMCKLGVYYISAFIGRLEENNENGIQLLHEIRHMIDQYNFPTELLAASIRSVTHMHESILAGCDAATMPAKILEEITQHSLTNKGIEIFDADWKKLGVKQFP